jgi:hypothetical protein
MRLELDFKSFKHAFEIDATRKNESLTLVERRGAAAISRRSGP